LGQQLPKAPDEKHNAAEVTIVIPQRELLYLRPARPLVQQLHKPSAEKRHNAFADFFKW
jgi:hypothetical protein